MPITDRTDLTPEQIDILLHTVGLDQSEKMYRDFFITNMESPDYLRCMDLREKGYLILDMDSNPNIFRATEKTKDCICKIKFGKRELV